MAPLTLVPFSVVLVNMKKLGVSKDYKPQRLQTT